MASFQQQQAIQALEKQAQQEFERRYKQTIEIIKANESDKRQSDFNQRLAEFHDSRTDKNGSTDWDKVKEDAKRTGSAEAAAYNSEWKMAMMSLVAMLQSLVQAGSNDMYEHVWMPLGFKLTEALRTSITRNPTADQVIPVLVHEAKLNDKHCLEVNLTMDNASDGDVGLNDIFKNVVESWLVEQGYEPTKDGTFINTSGKALESAEFEQLKNDPEHGLSSFLDTNSELQYRSSMRP